jgi:hypothetical protein
MPNQEINVTTPLATDYLQKLWGPTFAPAANEERRVTLHFAKPDGVDMIGNQLVMRKVDTVGVQSISATQSAIKAALIFETDAETVVYVNPTRTYAAIQIPRAVKTRMGNTPAFWAVKKRQLLAGLIADMDSQGAALATSLGTNIVGGVGQDLTNALIAFAISKLSASAKNMFSPGRTRGYLCVHPAQIDDLILIDAIVNAQIRGDGQSAAAGTWDWDAYNLQIAESGNISTSGGAAHNMLYVEGSHLLGYNEEPTLLPEETDGMSTACIGTVEFGVQEFFDEWAVDIQTKAA